MRNDGGPAFPVFDKDMGIQWSGVSVRDYFAAKAMQAMIRDAFLSDKPANEATDIVCKAAYSIADAMLKARENFNE